MCKHNSFPHNEDNVAISKQHKCLNCNELPLSCIKFKYRYGNKYNKFIENHDTIQLGYTIYVWVGGYACKRNMEHKKLQKPFMNFNLEIT